MRQNIAIAANNLSVALRLERVPGWAAREFKIAEIGTEAEPDA
jgi:hypothetical protein